MPPESIEEILGKLFWIEQMESRLISKLFEDSVKSKLELVHSTGKIRLGIDVQHMEAALNLAKSVSTLVRYYQTRYASALHRRRLTIVCDGVHTFEDLTVPVNFITFKSADPNNQSILKGTLYMNRKKGIKFENLEIHGFDEIGRKYGLVSISSDVDISLCNVDMGHHTTRGRSWGLRVQGGNVTASNCGFRNGYYGINAVYKPVLDRANVKFDDWANVKFDDCVFENNFIGVCVHYSKVTLTKCTFTNTTDIKLLEKTSLHGINGKSELYTDEMSLHNVTLEQNENTIIVQEETTETTETKETKETKLRL
jgi:hypothetical protein